MNAKLIAIDSDDETTRYWYEIDGGTYAKTSDNRILDEGGCPMTERDSRTIQVRAAIERMA